MGQSVLIPEENLLGKVGEPFVASLDNGRKGIRDKIPKPACGEMKETSYDALKQLTTVGRQGSLACGEFSFLFDIAGASNIISGGERRLNTSRKRPALLGPF